MRIGGVDVVPTAKATFKAFNADDLQGLAAEVAYHLLFSIVPLLIFLTALSGFIGRAIGTDDAVANITEWAFSNLPAETASAVRDPIQNVVQREAGEFLSVGAVLALWGGRNAITSLMKALNVAFDVKETRPWWKRQAVGIGLTVALGLAIITASGFFVLGSALGDTVADWIGLGETWAFVWSILRWPLIVILLMAALAFLYWAGPNVTASFRWLTPGAILAVVLWGVATAGLGVYFRYFGGYAETYGVLGGVLAFVFWLYLMSLILLLGGELNATLAEMNDPAVRAQTAAGSAPAKRKLAIGQDIAERPPASSRPVPAVTIMPAVTVPFPSAEGDARETLASEGPAGRERRFREALKVLGVSVATAVSGAILAGRRR